MNIIKIGDLIQDKDGCILKIRSKALLKIWLNNLDCIINIWRLNINGDYIRQNEVNNEKRKEE